MSGKTPYDFGYRPATYWETPGALLANIKGEQRRRRVKEFLDSGNVEALESWVLSESLSEEERVALGRIHPLLMGGEYLPDYEGSEVEVARVALQSTTGDVISVRACRNDGTIRYRVVDEYESQFECSPAESREPLSFQELIALIDGTRNVATNDVGLTEIFRESNLGEGTDPEELLDFVSVSSVFYRQLDAYIGMRRFGGLLRRRPVSRRWTSP